MKRIGILLAVVVAVAWPTVDAWGRGGGGRGGGFGGGGARMGGGGGGFSRPSPSMSRPSPSMNRPSSGMSRPTPRPSTGRPASGMGGAGVANHGPSMSRPNGGGFGGAGGLGGAGSAANRGTAGNRGQFSGRPQAGDYARPSQRDVSSFLNMPSSPSTRSGVASTLPARGASGIRTATGPGGGSVTVGGIGGSRTGPGGTTVGAGRVGVKVTGPGGNSYTKVAGGAAVRGPYGNTVAAGRGASFVNGQFVGGRTWSAVNGNFRHWGYYGPGWAARYPGCWWPGRWAVAGTIWATTAWATAGAYCGCSSEPAYYDYSQMSYQEGNVYYGDESLGTTQEYYDQTTQLANQGAEPTNEEWLPLGVFGIVPEDGTEAEKTLQLAVNKQGVIRGNYHDLLTDQVTPVTGAVDKETQRVAIRLQGNDNLVLETGLYNLTNDEVPALIHLDKDRQVSRVLVRLKQPEDQASSP